MNVKKLFGLLALAGLLFLAAPAPRAQAVSLISPGLAEALVLNKSAEATTEVRYRYRRYYVRRYYVRRHYGYRRHYHRRHYRFF